MFINYQETDRSKKLKIAVQTCVDYATINIGRGGILLYTTMESITGIKYRSDLWSDLSQRFRAKLVSDHGISVVCRKTVGYVLPTDWNQITGVTNSYIGKSSRAMFRAQRATCRANTKNLTAHQRAYYASRLREMRRVRSLANVTKRLASQDVIAQTPVHRVVKDRKAEARRRLMESI